MLGVADGKWLCLIVATFTLASSFFNFQVGDDGLISKEYYSEWATGVMEVAVCCPYVALKLLEFVYNLLARQSKSRITCRPTGHQPFLWSHQPFIDTVIFVVISYLILLDINWSFVWLAIFPVTAIVFIRALYLKFNNSTTAYSNVIEETNRETMEFEIIAMTLMALLFMDLLPPEYAAAGFSISQFLLFLSCTMASLTRMMMKLPTSASPGIAPASGMLHKTLIVLLLVTAHTVAAEWLGVDVVLLCLPEVIPVLLCFLLHIHRKPGSSSIINVDKMKAHMINWLGKVGAVVVAPLFAHLLLTMDESGLSGWCTAFQVSCGVSGILTRYLVFMLNHWTRQQVAAAGKEDGASVMLKLWAYALLTASAASLLLWYMVSLRLGLQPPLHATAMYVGSLFGFTFNYSN